MKKAIFILVCFALLAPGVQATTINYGNISLSGVQSGHFSNGYWDLAASPLTISFRLNLNGMVDDFGGNAHAWAQLGIRQIGYGDFNPTWQVEGAGVWLSTDYDWTANTFDPDPPGSPTLDLDDKLMLQKGGNLDEGGGYWIESPPGSGNWIVIRDPSLGYNLPSPPPNPYSNHRFWFDRDGVDQWQAQNPLAVDGGTYNTGGFYDIVMTLTATGLNTGTAFMTINGLHQGFETDGDWKTMELTPAGMTFTGDMTKMQIFYGLYGYGATHSVNFNNITATGYFIPEPGTFLLLGFGLLGLAGLSRKKIFKKS